MEDCSRRDIGGSEEDLTLLAGETELRRSTICILVKQARFLGLFGEFGVRLSRELGCFERGIQLARESSLSVV